MKVLDGQILPYSSLALRANRPDDSVGILTEFHEVGYNRHLFSRYVDILSEQIEDPVLC